ncbi:hypothetical protein Efla_000343 [Eimeria flavescens]
MVAGGASYYALDEHMSVFESRVLITRATARSEHLAKSTGTIAARVMDDYEWKVRMVNSSWCQQSGEAALGLTLILEFSYLESESFDAFCLRVWADEEGTTVAVKEVVVSCFCAGVGAFLLCTSDKNLCSCISTKFVTEVFEEQPDGLEFCISLCVRWLLPQSIGGWLSHSPHKKGVLHVRIHCPRLHDLRQPASLVACKPLAAAATAAAAAAGAAVCKRHILTGIR